MKLAKKQIIAIVAVVVVLVAAGGGYAYYRQAQHTVGQGAPMKKESKDMAIEKPEEEPAAEEIPANQNLLTGVPDLSDAAIGKRPVAVMINNVQDAMPQIGVGQADLIFEIPVEGDQTRFMAIFGDYTKVPYLCAIRSCRYYFPALSQGFDAFYVHWGMDDSMAEYIDALQLDRFDGMANTGGLYGRDQNRLGQGYALEHTGYFDGTQFAGYVDGNGYRTDLKEEYKDAAFDFNGLNDQIAPEGNDCNSVDINFGAQTSQFAYDANTKTYKKGMNGQPQIDGNTNEQLSFTDVFVLETSISVRDEVGHKEIDWDGDATASTGYYISNGKVQKIHWFKDPNNEWSKLRFTDEAGNPLSINRGKIYIALNYPGQTAMQ